MKTEFVNLSIQMSKSLNELLERMVQETHKPLEDVLKRAIFLMDVAINSRREGRKLAILDNNNNKIEEVIWL